MTGIEHVTQGEGFLPHLKLLEKSFPALWASHDEVSFEVDNYVVDFVFRGEKALVVTFNPMNVDKSQDPSTKPGWGLQFLRRKGGSAIHIKPKINCWYRGPALKSFLTKASELGVFDSFEKVMTYGGSMGGFGAMSYSKICKATICFAINPQAKLGSDVRSWENRFLLADRQNWNDSLCDVSEQLSEVRYVGVAYDPRCTLDRMHVDLINKPGMVYIKIPFVGHNLPAHLQQMNLLEPLFDSMLAENVVLSEYNKLFKRRRELLRYKNELLARAKGRRFLIEIIRRNLSKELRGMA